MIQIWIRISILWKKIYGNIIFVGRFYPSLTKYEPTARFTKEESRFGSRVEDKHVQRTLTSFPPLFFLLTFHFLFCQSYVTKHPTFCSLNPINLWVNAMNWRGRSGPYTSHLEWQIDSHSRRINATKHKRVEIIPKHLLGMRIYPAKPMRINQSLFCESILGSFLWVNFVI